MNDVAPPKDAFAEMMTAAKDPWYTAVLYRAWLEHADPEEPLWRTPYFGQVVRSGTAEEIFKVRKRGHECDAARKDKDLGFLAVLDTFGSDAIEWEIMSSKSGPRTAMQELANAEEKRLIAAHGGVLRDMDTKLEQTLNLTEGGQGDARARWTAIDARRRRALNKFKSAMETYVAENGSALVPQAFISKDGYKLGAALGGFRCGQMWKGRPEEADIKAWAEALTKWAWNAKDTDEWHEDHIRRGHERSRKAFCKFKAAMEAYVKEHGTAIVPYKYVDSDDNRLGEQLGNFRRGEMRKGLPEEKDINAWAEALPGWMWNGKETDEWRECCVRHAHEKSLKAFCKFKAAMETYVAEHGSALVPAAYVDADGYRLGQNLNSFRKGTMWKSMPIEAEVVSWANALSKWSWNATKTDEYRKEFGKRSAEQHAARTRAELVRARLLAVPFEKSQTRRAKMRAASEDFWGPHGNAKLYMISKDGQTIRRVQNDGCMGERYTVGPVVDPAPPDAFGSD